MTRTTKLLMAVAALAIGLAAWKEWAPARPAAKVEPAPAAASSSPPADAPNAASPARESSATYEMPVEGPSGMPSAPPEEPALVPAAAPTEAPPLEPLVVEERPADTPSRCLTLEATPSSISAYGATGAAMQLVVRARNGCSTGFSGRSTYFRAVATSYEGFDLASAVGRFSGEINPFGTAETLIALEVDPTRVRSWRVELR